MLSYLKKVLYCNKDEMRKLKEAYRQVAASEAGQTVFRHLLDVSQLYSPVDSGSDPMKLSYYNGRKDMALIILKNIHETPEETEKYINHLNKPTFFEEI